MRGSDSKQEAMFSYVSPEARVPTNHPLRPIRAMVSEALAEMDGKLEKRYSQTGRPSIAPERLIRALLLEVLYSIRSERLLVEQLEYNLLFRWFVGLSVDEPVWDHSTFSKNRDRFLEADIARELFEAIVEQARMAGVLSDEHFSVDGTMIQAWASHKSFRPKDGPGPGGSGGRNEARDFRGEQRANDTHASTTDPEAKLYKKSDTTTAKLAYLGHAVSENKGVTCTQYPLPRPADRHRPVLRARPQAFACVASDRSLFVGGSLDSRPILPFVSPRCRTDAPVYWRERPETGKLKSDGGVRSWPTVTMRHGAIPTRSGP